MLSMMNLPKLELQVFDGNPLHYHQFKRSFIANVDKVCDDPDIKLSRLIQYISSVAREAIRSCQLIGGSVGYKKALDILHSRLSNSQLVTALLVLNELKTEKEANCQVVFLEIVDRLPRFVQMRWKKLALDKVETDDSFPGIEELASFLVKISVEMSNPVYGNTFPKRHGGASANSQSFTSISGGVHRTKNTTSAGAQAGTSGIKQKTYAKPERPCVLCNESHRLWHCKLFKGMKPLEVEMWLSITNCVTTVFWLLMVPIAVVRNLCVLSVGAGGSIPCIFIVMMKPLLKVKRSQRLTTVVFTLGIKPATCRLYRSQ